MSQGPVGSRKPPGLLESAGLLEPPTGLPEWARSWVATTHGVAATSGVAGAHGVRSQLGVADAGVGQTWQLGPYVASERPTYAEVGVNFRPSLAELQSLVEFRPNLGSRSNGSDYVLRISPNSPGQLSRHVTKHLSHNFQGPPFSVAIGLLGPPQHLGTSGRPTGTLKRGAGDMGPTPEGVSPEMWPD